jgi:hypothetical protein
MSENKMLLIVGVLVAAIFIAFGVSRYMKIQRESAAVEFGASPLGQEMESAIKACAEAKEQGRLPGFTVSRQSGSFGISSNLRNFEDRNVVNYPMEVICHLDYKTDFILRRDSEGAIWQIAPGMMHSMPFE